MPNKAFLPPDDLARAVLDGVESMVRDRGRGAVNMRAIAHAVGCSVGTVYNAIGPLEDVFRRLNARTIGRLADALAASRPRGEGELGHVLGLADTYLDFVTADAALWRLVLERVGDPGDVRPPAVVDAVARAVAVVERALEGLIVDREARRQAVLALWASLHGIASLSVGGRLSVLGDADPHEVASDLIQRYFAV